MTKLELDPPDDKIHVRKHPDDAIAKPVWCGKTGQASITEAWGYYGPGGDGHDDVCHECVDAQRAELHDVPRRLRGVP